MNQFYTSIIAAFLLLPTINTAQKSIELFNGKNLKGWYAYTKTRGIQNKADDVFEVENNMIRLQGKNIGYLMSKKSFKNFVLTAEFKWNTDIETTKKRNSGLMYLVPKNTEDMLWPKGIQFQIKEGATGDFILLQETTIVVNGIPISPGKSVVSERFIDAFKPIGEWNILKIHCIDGTIKQELNGVLVNQGTEASIDQGRILLQYEGSAIDFRNIIIMKQ